MRSLKSILLSFLFFVTSHGMVLAQGKDQIIVENPASFSLELIDDLEKKGAEFLSDKVVLALDNPEGKSKILPTLKRVEKKKADIVKIVSDKSYNGVVRVVTIYTFGLIPGHPYLYFQITYKMSPKGWVMTYFNLETELEQAFPSDMKHDVN
jgi:hypothetical protein